VVTVPSGARNTPVGFTLADNDADDGVTVTVRKSVNPPKLVKVIVEVPATLGGVEMEVGFAATPKSVRFEKNAPRVVSLFGVPVPLDMVTEGSVRAMFGVLETTL
jgi:hypothetical protein